MSERLADEFGAEVKYGGGSEQIQKQLRNFANYIINIETAVEQLAQVKQGLASVIGEILDGRSDGERDAELENIDIKLAMTDRALDEAERIIGIETEEIPAQTSDDPEARGAQDST